MKCLRLLRLILSFLVLLAVGKILTHLVESRPGFSVFSFFSFFTNQSNLCVAIFFLADALFRWRGRPFSRRTYDRTRGALFLYMSMTTGIYWLLLHKLVHFTDPLAAVANVFLHTGCWLFLLVDLYLDSPETTIPKKFLAVWMIYPILYGVAIMGLGHLRSWYPYPFLNIDKMGFTAWARWNGMMVLSIALLGLVIVLYNNWLQRIRRPRIR